jgi:hypothetical protein
MREWKDGAIRRKRAMELGSFRRAWEEFQFDQSPPGNAMDWYRRWQEALNAQAYEGGHFVLNILNGAVFVHVMSFQKTIDLITCLKPEQTPQIGFVDLAIPVLVSRPSFQSPAWSIAAGRIDETLSEIIGYLNGQLHGWNSCALS